MESVIDSVRRHEALQLLQPVENKPDDRLRAFDSLQQQEAAICRHASPAQWKEVERLIASGVDTGPMTSGVFHAVLTGGDQDKVVAHLHSVPVDAEPLATVEALDAYLRNQPIDLRLRMIQDD